jgi:2-polyprenyl-3-methyl-5-hydroxy-6-metoxy-1,4-benzoquinol methylase
MSSLTEEMKIEILSTDLLSRFRPLVEDFRHLSFVLQKELGWHYLLDLSWAASQLCPYSRMNVLDAGAGTGIMQWWLADQKVNVISTDNESRYNLPTQFRQLYRLKGLRKNDLAPMINFSDFFPSKSSMSLKSIFYKAIDAGNKICCSTNFKKKGGIVYIYNHDLVNLIDISDNVLDAVVSISALEHNSPEKLRIIVMELMRVVKPGGKLIATLGAAIGKDWFHEPSNGWCYTEATLREIFNLPMSCSSNYDQYNKLFEALHSCNELRESLSDFYFKSGNNGMPWGKWDPQYQPVGIVKVKN